MVGPPGFEPGTSPLSGARSDQLSYGPSRVSGTGRGLAVQRGPYHGREPCLKPVMPAPDLRATGGLRGGESARGLPARAWGRCVSPPCTTRGGARRQRRRCQCGAGRDQRGRRAPRGVGEGRRPSPWGLPRRFPARPAYLQARDACRPSAQHPPRCAPNLTVAPPRTVHPHVCPRCADRGGCPARSLTTE